MKEYFWVPEEAIFDSAADATEFKELGAGTLVANHVAYDKLKEFTKDIAKAECYVTCGCQRKAIAALNKIKPDLEVRSNYGN